MLASELIYTIKTLYTRRPTDDEDVSDAQWFHLINQWRAKLLRQDLSDGKDVGNLPEQTIYLQLARLDKGEKNYLKTCRAYESIKFPQLLLSKHGEHISRIAENPLESSYKRTTFNNLPYLLSSRLTSRAPKVVLADERLYVYSADIIEEVTLTGIFENPQTVNQFLGKEDIFNPYNFEYPISMTMVDALYRGIMDTSFRMLKATQPDLLNDGHIPTQ